MKPVHRASVDNGIFAFLLAIVLTAALFLLPHVALAATSVSYVERSWSGGNTTGSVTSTTKTCSSYTTLSSDSKNKVSLGSGWYVLSSDVSYSKCLQITGNAKIILCDGKTLSANDGIYIVDGCTLTVYGQSGDSGKISAYPDSGPGIGGVNKTMGGSLVVHGGTIDAKGKTNAAGIGGGNHEESGMRDITIYGGTVTAKGGPSGAGIGKGQQNDSFGTVTIYGGTVTATGSDYGAGIGGGEDRGSVATKIYGGTVTATGGADGAGIGGGEGGSGNDATIEIYGGTVKASSKSCGAGIGGGENGAGGKVYIYGGDVTATGGEYGAGIGGGKNANGGTLTISGDTTKVTATGGRVAAGIGAGISDGIATHSGGTGGTLTIEGGDVTVTGGSDDGPGIGGLDKTTVTITGGTLKVQNGGNNGPGIGVMNGGAVLNFTMTGGNVSVVGGTSDAGIGGASSKNIELQIKISGGTLTASSTEKGAGIGSGEASDILGIEIGGNVTENSKIEISGGTVSATGGDKGSGIGSGRGGNQQGTISITGGTVTATGNGGGAGIGGGKEGSYDIGGNAGTIKITGGTVTAVANGDNDAQAIGHGANDENEGSLTLGDNMCVDYSGTTASKDDRVSVCRDHATRVVRECGHADHTYTSTKTTHTQTCKYCYTNFSAEAHTYGDGNKCTVCGYQGPLCTISFDANGGSGSMDSVTAVPGREYQLPAPGFTAPDGTAFAVWRVSFDGGSTYTDALPGQTVTVPSSTEDFSATATAIWEDKCFISFEPGEGGGDMDPVLVDVGSTYTLPECYFTQPDHKAFKEWSVATVGTDEDLRKQPGDTIAADNHKTVTAIWDDAYAVSLDLGRKVSEDPVTVNVLKDGNFTFPSGENCGLDIPEGWTFVEWSVKVGDAEAVTVRAGETVPITADTTATAKWMSDWSDLQSLLDSGGSLTLTKDYVATDGDSPLTVSSSLTLDLDGHTVDGSLCDVNPYLLQVSNGASLTLMDSSGSGEISYEAESRETFRVVQVDAGASLAMGSGGIIGSGGYETGTNPDVYTECYSVYLGGEGARFTMSGGRVSATGSLSYGVYLDTGASFDMSAGRVDAKGLYNNGVIVRSQANFSMSGGALYCRASSRNSFRGVDVYSDGSFSLEGAFYISGESGDSSNWNGVYLRSGSKIDVSGPLADDVDIYIGMWDQTGVFTSGLDANGDSAKGTISNFMAHDFGKAVGINEDGEAYIDMAIQIVTFEPGEGASDESAYIMLIAKDSYYTLPECGFTASEGKAFKEWSVQVGDAEAQAKQPGETIIVSADTTVTAIWGTAASVNLDPGEGYGYLISKTVLQGSEYTLPTCEDCDFVAPAGYAFKEWSVKVGDAEAQAKQPGDTISVSADTTATALWEESSPALGAQVYGHTLTLEGQIGINTYFWFGSEILQDASDYQVEYWNGSELASATSVSEGSQRTEGSLTLYGFSVTTVAKEMDTEFTMKLKQLSTGTYVSFANAGGETVDADTGLSYSVMDYLEDRIANSTNSNMVRLAKAMKAYGIYAKHYFAVRDGGSDEALPSIEGFELVPAETLAGYACTAPGDITNFDYQGSTLVLEDRTSFRLYFKSDDPNALTITTTINNETSTLTPQGAKDMYYVEIPNIVAKELDVMYDFSIVCGTESASAHHGPFGYAYWALAGTDNANLQYLMSALYYYNQAAKSYFGA